MRSASLDQTSGDPEDRFLSRRANSQVHIGTAAVRQAPQNDVLANSAVSAANDLASTLNNATNTVQQVRGQADSDIASSVSRLNDLLAQFETVNNEIKLGSPSSTSPTNSTSATRS